MTLDEVRKAVAVSNCASEVDGYLKGLAAMAEDLRVPRGALNAYRRSLAMQIEEGWTMTGEPEGEAKP